MIGIESVWKRFWRGSSGQRVVAKVGSLPPMLQPGGSCCTTSVKVGPQKVQNRPPLTFGIGQRRVLQRWVQLLPNIQLIGAIVPLIGIEPKTRLLIFCPWRKSTSIPPVLPPPRNRITPVNITRPLSIFPATGSSTGHPTTFDPTHWSALYKMRLPLSFPIFIHIVCSPTPPGLFGSLIHLAVKTVFGHFCYFLFLQDRKYFHPAVQAAKRDKLPTN